MRRTGFRKKTLAEFKAQQAAKKKKQGAVRIVKKAQLAVRSKKQNARLARYALLRKKFLEEHPFCAVCWTRFKKIEDSSEIHHREGRHGEAMFDESTFVATCFSCGRWVHNNPVEASMLGFMPQGIMIRTLAFQRISATKK